MAVSKMYVKRMLAECNQITINISMSKEMIAQCYTINHEPYEANVARY
jgi:hypothetical protein